MGPQRSRLSRVVVVVVVVGVVVDIDAQAASLATPGEWRVLAVPRHRLNTYRGRAFAVAGPTVWNSLPDFIRDPSISTDSFRRLLKTYLFARY